MEEFDDETRRQYLAEFDEQHRRATMYFLSTVTQKSSVTDLHVEFEELTQGVTGLFEPLVISYFISALRPEIQREVLRLRRPSTLLETFILARSCEARVEVRQSIDPPSVPSPDPLPSPKLSTPPPMPSISFPQSSEPPIISSGSLPPIPPYPSPDPQHSDLSLPNLSPDPSIHSVFPILVSSNPSPYLFPLPPLPGPPSDEQKHDIVGQRTSSETASMSKQSGVEEPETVVVSHQARMTSPDLFSLSKPPPEPSDPFPSPSPSPSPSFPLQTLHPPDPPAPEPPPDDRDQIASSRGEGDTEEPEIDMVSHHTRATSSLFTAIILYPRDFHESVAVVPLREQISKEMATIYQLQLKKSESTFSVVKSRQITYSMLKHLSDYLHNLKRVGRLEEKEMLGALYKESSKSNGIWLISPGVVKWESNHLNIKHSLHPTFTHGSTLGLYEVLIGKPYICDMITDSVVHCFFIETEKVLSLLKSAPAIEDFFWQESAIVISKILLPQIFEKMGMPELRRLVAERSTMKNYISGEVIEIKPNYVGFLLEGFLRPGEAQQELIASPAALLLSFTDLSSSFLDSSGGNNASFCHQGSSYQVETRARIIFFDIGTTEDEGALQQRSASWISQSMEPLRTHSREHGGLLSWPESFYKARSHHQSPNEDERKSNHLSAKAMELSIYGSMVNDVRRCYRNFRRNSQGYPSHSYSYPRVPSRPSNARPLLSVQSEGGNTNMRLGSRDYSRLAPLPPLPVRKPKKKVVHDESSDESGGEEIIVRIDSPSALSFCQTSENLFLPNEGS